jgi:UDP-N-acetylmuramoyl-tripeptide--D-alanyl-D-alanine ligase
VGPVDVDLREDGAHVAFGGGRIRFPFRSRHQAQNALTALTAYDALGLPLDRLPESAAAVRLSPWRGEELALSDGGFVVNDAYNANPTSMEAALRHLAERGAGRRLIAILGGMAELGEHADVHHREIAELAEELGIEVIAVGELGRAYAAATWEPDAAGALAAARDLVRPGDAVLVKASRAVALEGIAPELANLPA